MDARPLILTARFDEALFQQLDRLRKRYFPPERNFLPAHATMFHHLPGEELERVRMELTGFAGAPPLACSMGELKFTGRGMHVAVECDRLRTIRRELAERWAGWLTPQDHQPYRPHVTVQNKADPAAARAAFDELRSQWTPLSGWVTGLDLWHYAGGPWEPAGRVDFDPVT